MAAGSKKGRTTIHKEEDTLRFLITILEFVGNAMGENTELLIHDAKTREIIWIKNGHITRRSVGNGNAKLELDVLAKRAAELGDPSQLVGYKSQTGDRHELRSSNLFLNDEKGELAYVVCINQDVSQLVQMKDMLGAMLGQTPLKIEKGYDTAETQESNIETMTVNLIMEEIENSKPFSLDSREMKFEILRRLQDKGVFEVRRAVPKVCEILQISQSSLYKYLQKLKAEDDENEND